MDFLLKYFLTFDGPDVKKTVYVSSYIVYIAIIVWQVVDVVLFGLNVYVDGNGMPLWVYTG